MSLCSHLVVVRQHVVGGVVGLCPH
eukprot:SAG11_NODE_24538_length_372_cov_0.468864_1_plen_24_part_10